MAFQYPLVLDGGFATELEKQFNKDLSGKLWSAQCLKDDPNAVKAVHKSYFQVGANVATTCSYQASIEGFLDAGYSQELAIELMNKSVTLAIEAREEFDRENPDDKEQRLIALSIGCYGAILANGSEYTGNYGDVTIDQLKDFHRKRLEIFLENKVDFVLFETIPSRLEAKAIALLVKEIEGLPPVGVAFQCRSDHEIADGTDLLEMVGLYDQLEAVFAVGANCTKPQHIERLVERVAKYQQNANKKALLLYPDGGEVWNAVERTWDSSCKVAEDKFGFLLAKCVQDYGSRVLVGGCCGTGPSHIKKLKEQLSK